MEKLSVIVPVYNVEIYLARCVDSILAQSYESFELILVDDGSKDSSGEICDKYAKADGRIKVIHKENGGVSEARNTGLDLATGDYIMFIDSDDEILQDFFENAISKVDGMDWYISGYKEILKVGDKIIENISQSKQSKQMTVAELYSKLGQECPLESVKAPWAKLYKREIIEKYNIRFNKKLDIGEDALFNVNFCERAKDVYFDNNCYYLYHRENENALTSKFHPDKYEIDFFIYNEWRRVIQKIGVDENGLKKFEDVYFGAMIYNIGCVYRHKRSKREKKEIIKKVVNDDWIHQNRTYGHNFSSKVMRFLITRKLTTLVRMAFAIKCKH